MTAAAPTNEALKCVGSPAAGSPAPASPAQVAASTLFVSELDRINAACMKLWADRGRPAGDVVPVELWEREVTGVITAAYAERERQRADAMKILRLLLQWDAIATPELIKRVTAWLKANEDHSG